MNNTEKKEWVEEVIRRARGWKFIYGRLDDFGMLPKVIVIKRVPGFRFFFRLWPFFLHVGFFTEKMMREQLSRPSPGIWLKGRPELTVSVPRWVQRRYVAARNRWRIK